MISAQEKKLFTQYYQTAYDFNTRALSNDDIEEIKLLVKEKRMDYALAPIGEKIFDFIMVHHLAIHLESAPFEDDKLDAMLHIPKNDERKAYIILNGNKPLTNQIFALAHAYYHYIKNCNCVHEKSYIYNLHSLTDINEKRASRFASEFLLPEQALQNEMKHFLKKMHYKHDKDVPLKSYAMLCVFLTIKYQLPLKAVIYRLHEDGYIHDMKRFTNDDEVIKCLLTEIEISKERMDTLYAQENQYINSDSSIYRQMESVHKAELVSRSEILKDAKLLELNMDLITKFLGNVEDTDVEDVFIPLIEWK